MIMRPHPKEGTQVQQTPHALWPPRFKAAIFDFDGTISDTATIWHEVDRAFLSSRGLPYTDEYPRMLSSLGFEAGARYTIETFGLRESVAEVCEEWKRMGRALFESHATLRPGVQLYVHALTERGVRVALATVNDRDVLKSLRHVDVEALFEVCVYGGEVARPKDHPDIYLETARRLGIEPTDCIVFEDIATGLRSASSVGMLTCGVRSFDPVQRVDEVRSAADLWLDDWRDIGPGAAPGPRA